MADIVAVHSLDSATVTTYKGKSGIVAKVEVAGVLVGYCYSFYHAGLHTIRYATTNVAYASHPTLKGAVAALVNPKAVNISRQQPDRQPGWEHHRQNRWHQRKDFK